MEYNIVFTGIQDSKKLFNNMSDIRKETSNVNKKFEGLGQRISDSLGVGWVFENITGAIGSMKNFAISSFSTMKNVFSSAMTHISSAQQTFSTLKQTGYNTMSSISNSMLAMGGTGKTVLKNLMMGVVALGISLYTIAAPIAAIAAGFFVLKKAWDANIGGIQTIFNDVMGDIKDAWANFNNNFIKTLRKLEPVFIVIFDGMKKSFNSIIIPILNGLNMFKQMFKDAFGGGAEDMQKLINFGKVLGKTFQVMGKIIGKAFKILFIILKPVVVLIIKIIEGISWLVEKMPKSWFNGSGKKVDEKSESPTAAANKGRQNTGSNVNNNQKITVITSREISEDGANDFGRRMADNLSQKG